jgi:hypothetical protein
MLKRACDALGPAPLQAYIEGAPNGVFARRLRAFYEPLAGQHLDIPDAPEIAEFDALDPAGYITLDGPQLAARRRVRDNPPGCRGFRPIGGHAETLERFMAVDLAGRVPGTIGAIGAHLVLRDAIFMLLADGQASFAIEDDHAPGSRQAAPESV